MVDRKLIKQGFQKDSDPHLSCPTCNAGSLEFSIDRTLIEEQAWVKKARSDEYFEHEWSRYNFSTVLICSNPYCRESVAASGEAFFEEDYEIDDEHGPYPIIYKYYRPFFFHPPLMFFIPPDGTPKETKEALVSSFKLFFTDPSASANYVRHCLELLLNSLKVKRFSRKKGKNTRLALHARIVGMPARYKESRDLLLALKWLGNSGSHAGSRITEDDVLDAYEILEFLLIELFSNRRKNISSLARKIIKSKGPLKSR